MKKPPNPGSKQAIEMGCLCPVIDNHYGKGIPMPNNNKWFIYDMSCPIHYCKDIKKDERK